MTPHQLRILFVAKWYPHPEDPQNGVFVRNHALAAAKFAKVGVIYLGGKPHPDEPKEYSTEFGDIREYRIMSPFEGNTILRWNKKRKAFKRGVRHIFGKRNPDVIHLHVLSPDQIIATTYARKKDIPVVLTEHWSGYLNGAFEEMVRPKQQSFRYLARQAKKVLPVSEFLGKWMSRKLGVQTEVLPNVVVLPDERDTQKNEDFTFVVLADMVDEVKQISETIEAFAEHLNSFPKDKLLLIGGGPDESSLRNHAASHLPNGSYEFTGRLPQPEALTVMTKGHVLVVNSLYETFGVVGLEALSLGLPVVCRRCGGPEEIMPDGGTLFYDDSPRAYMKQARENYNELKDAIDPASLERFSPERIAERMERIYREVSS
ncbi:MAG: glycosyltransferase [Bacteroidota bacterium]|nr:glycosyltransferase [Bacteroidota bacterium]